MKVYNSIWTILLKSFNNQDPSIADVMRIVDRVNTITSKNTLHSVEVLYEMLSKSYADLFQRMIPAFQSLDGRKLLSSFLAFTDSFNKSVRVAKMLFYPITCQSKFLKQESFQEFPTPVEFIQYIFNQDFYQPLKSKIDECVDEMLLELNK